MEQVLPCQPYIIRSLQDGEPAKVVEAGKNFFLKYLETGLSEEDAYSFLLSLEQMAAIGTKRPSFFSKDGQNISIQDYRDAILADRKLKRIPCETLYKRCDRQLLACQFCPVRLPFQERQLAMEKSVASFAFSGERSFREFSDALKKQDLAIKDCFFIHVDISDILFLAKPYSAPALQILMEALAENETMFFHGICAGEMESIRQDFFHKLESFRRFPKELKEKKDVRSILYAKVSALLLTDPIPAAQLDKALSQMKEHKLAFEAGCQKEAADVKEDMAEGGKSKEAEKLLNQFLNETGKQEKEHKPPVPAKASPPAKKEIKKEIPEEAGRQEPPVSEMDTKESDGTDHLPNEITIKELLDKPAMEHTISEEQAGTVSTQQEKGSQESSEVSVSERQNGREPVPARPPVPATAQKAAGAAEAKADKKTAIPAAKKKKVKYAASQQTLFDIMKDLPDGDASFQNQEADHGTLRKPGMYLPTITQKELTAYTKPLTRKEAYYFLNLAGRTGNLVLEVFFDAGNVPVLILYDTAGKKFFHVQAAAAPDQILLQMMGHKSIRKICVNPYTLYGYAYTFSCFPKNVFSFLMHGLTEGLFQEKKLKRLPDFLSLMTYYHTAADTDSGQGGPIPDRKLLLDAAFGCSLMTNRFFHERHFLFQLDEIGKIRFQLPKKLTPLQKGTFLMYSLTHASDLDTGCLFHDLLASLCQHGRFKNIPFQVLYLGSASILFFVEADYLKRFDSICTIQLTELCEAGSVPQALLQIDMEQSYEAAEKKVRQWI